jgi:hypothetical protein
LGRLIDEARVGFLYLIAPIRCASFFKDGADESGKLVAKRRSRKEEHCKSGGFSEELKLVGVSGALSFAAIVDHPGGGAPILVAGTCDLRHCAGFALGAGVANSVGEGGIAFFVGMNGLARDTERRGGLTFGEAVADEAAIQLLESIVGA